ncbi:uncharacterized protein HKW66_Vig0143320 [Vigna angularis]|uniref:Major facilitator superfamily (MFS) profile domain-containing protein n=1 Tax=Phaseolus angularis TaxID=3914 RepID=A0A8T0KEU7_PHAAN|nr:uncharacterized protein HKW66_Vig0143320 [Vigna angularis]
MTDSNGIVFGIYLLTALYGFIFGYHFGISDGELNGFANYGWALIVSRVLFGLGIGCTHQRSSSFIIGTFSVKVIDPVPVPHRPAKTQERPSTPIPRLRTPVVGGLDATNNEDAWTYGVIHLKIPMLLLKYNYG